MDETDRQLKAPIDYFPMETPREKQVRAMDFVRRAHALNYRDIVIAAPTGIGKAAIGSGIALWAQQAVVPGKYEPGGYYLVTQKLLQDQLEGDIERFKPHLRRGCNLMAADAYSCPQYGNCGAGMRMKEDRRCRSAINGDCTYLRKRGLFTVAPLAITNYPYFFTERTYVGKFLPRRVAILDETHTLERQILNFVEINISSESMEEWAPHLRPVPLMEDINEFCHWLSSLYKPVIENRVAALRDLFDDNPHDRKVQDELMRTESHLGRIEASLESIEEDSSNWIYWQEDKGDGLESVAKPINAAAFMQHLVLDAAHTRVYMSAYPGPKGAFCRSLGLNPEKVAWLSLSSTFPIKNRPIHMTFVGSMGKRSIDNTLPGMVRMCERIARAHPTQKGLIHSHSYKIGQAIYDHINPIFPGRVIFPQNAKDRDSLFAYHRSAEEPTIMISPSMTEGFNLNDDLARWQIIAKMPYPFLGDKQVAAKKERDPDWYAMQTVMSVLQACGRIVRSDDDYGSTYILDQDFQMLFERYPDFFPGWFQESFVWHK